MRRQRLLAFLVFMGLPAGSVLASDGHQNHGEHESHADHHRNSSPISTEAHVHGEVTLQLAMQGNQLIANLRSPAANLIGFEQRARTPEQKQALALAEKRLRAVEEWFVLEGGNCSLTEVVPDLSGVQPAGEKISQRDPHADIRVDLQFVCAQPAKLNGLQLALFRDFPAVEKVTVQWLTEAAAGERILTRAKPRLRFDER